ncbi:DNA repair protein RecO [Cellulosilyticum sp. I15G10I2]|uniref:DNA repair protein RecO n=1 Tax=Cellulosilyticum sp. I15G10I2 TaxID=1892843 RepID=UPI00085BB434|nr:DNA repair protein RecO [Cellulosilyticum sp. I15G10I2]
MIIKTKALVIKEYIVGESDKYVTLFTMDLGKIQAIAPKAKKYDNSLASGTQLFVYGEFMLVAYKDTYRLMNIEIISTFHELRNDLSILSYASYILEFVAEVAQEGPDNENLLGLTLMTLRTLVVNKLSIQLIRRIFELRALCILGFMPELDQCVECAGDLGNDQRSVYTFVCEAGGLMCEQCRASYPERLDLSFSTLYTMKYIMHTPIKQLFSFQVHSSILHDLETVCDLYIPFYIEKSFKTADFIKHIEA